MSDNTVTITDQNFTETVLESEIPVLVDFWAPWCSPCVAIAPTLEALAEEYKGKVLIGKMNVDENADIPANYSVRSIPFLAMFKGGELFDSLVGSVPKAKLSDLLEKSIGGK